MPTIGDTVLIADPQSGAAIATNGVTLNAYKASRFPGSSVPPAGTPPPGGAPDAGPVLSGTNFGAVGAWELFVPTNEPYCVAATFGIFGPGWGLYQPAPNALFYNVKDYGALGTNTDDTTAILRAAAAMQATPVGSGILYLPPGVYNCSASLDFHSTNNIAVRGAGGVNAGGTPATRLFYTGTGSQFINAQSSLGCAVEDIQILSTQAGFTGPLVDGRGLAGGDTSFLKLARCYLGGTGAGLNKPKGVALDKSTTIEVSGNNFNNLDIPIDGQAASSYTQSVSVRGNQFISNNHGIHNPGDAWTVEKNTFEYLTQVAGVGKAQAVYHDNGIVSNAFTFRDNWHGDITDVTNPSTIVQWAGNGFVCTGNWFGGQQATVTAVSIDADNSTGIFIAGNHFLFNLVGVTVGSHIGIAGVFGPNSFDSHVTTQYALNNNPGAVVFGGGAGVGVGFFGKAGHSQVATPVTLSDVIALLQAYGLSA